jgi:CheY-like chemotaxis protein
MTKVNLYSVMGEVIYSESISTMETFSIMKFISNGLKATNLSPLFVDVHKTINEINHLNLMNVEFNIQSVMVVDDEPTLRELFTDSISRLGHFVEVFENAEQALNSLKKDPNRYNYIFTDNMMIGTDDGSKFAKVAKQINSKIKTFVVSGDIGSIDRDIFDFHVDGAIAKPLNAFAFSSTIGHARRKITQVLEKPEKVAA